MEDSIIDRRASDSFEDETVDQKGHIVGDEMMPCH